MGQQAPRSRTAHAQRWLIGEARRLGSGDQHGLAAAAHYATLLVAFFGLLALTRHQWFFFDEWEFISTRGWPLAGGLSWFAPHSEHWSTIPILIYRGLLAVFGVRTYLPYMAVLIAVHITIVHLLWRISLRCGATPWLATGLCAFLLFLGAGFEDLAWAFQMGFFGSLMFGLAGVLSADRSGSEFHRRYCVDWVTGVAALMCSGVGVTMVAVVGCTALLRRGLRAALLTVAVPAAVFAIWFLLIGHTGLASQPRKPDYLLLPAFIWRGLTHTVEASTGLPKVGVVVLIALLCWAIARGRQIPAATALALGSVLFFAIAGYGRLFLGVDESTASRYVYIAAALLLPLTASLVSRCVAGKRIAQLAALALFAFCFIHSAGLLRTQIAALVPAKQTSRGQLLAAADLLRQQVPVISTQPDDQVAPDLSTKALGALRDDGALPPLGGLSPTDYANGRYGLQVLWSATPVSPHSVGAVVVRPASMAPFQLEGCGRVEKASTAPVELDFRSAASVSIMVTTDGDARVQLARQEAPSVRSAFHSRSLLAAQTLFLNVAEAGTIVFLQVPGSSVQLCGMQAG